MTLYFNAAVDTDWDTLGNWWEDEPCTVAASALPTSSDDVVLLAICDANSGGDPTVANLEVSADSRSIWITITVTGLAMFSGVGSSNYGTITGDCVFSGEGSNNQGAVTGNCTFSGDYSYNDNATITGDCVFSGVSSSNYYGTITGNCEFTHATAWNQGTITGDAVFACAVGGVCTIGNNMAWGTVTGAVTGTDTTPITSWVFIDNGYNNGTITGDCVFSGDYSYNNGTITGDCEFSGYGSYNYGTITGDCVFSGEGSNNQGAVTGNCTFSGDYSFNRNATVTGTVTFRNLSSIIETFLVPSGYYEPSFANEPAGFKFPFADVLGTNLL